MISLLCALALAQADAPKLVKIDEPADADIAFALVAPLPKLGAQDMQLLECAVSSLQDGSEVYTGRTIRDLTDGRGVKCELLPDAVLISFQVPKESFSSGVAMLSSFVEQPSFRKESIQKAIAALTARPPTYWSLAMHPLPFDLKSTSRDELMTVFQRVFKPASVTVACVGDVSKENLNQAWATKTANWKTLPDPRFPDDSVLAPPAGGVAGVSTAAFRGAEFSATDSSLPARLLALYALGSGKGSSLFRISRDEHGWSYQQDSYLWPTASGFQPVLLVACRANPDLSKRMAQLQQELNADADAWTEEDRARALGMAEATLLRDVPFGPILLGDHPLQGGQDERACISAYWQMKTGASWNPAHLLESMKSVDLPALKAAAQDIFAHSTLDLLAGK